MMPGNPVVGGTVLRRPAIQSPNFVTTVSGWTVNADGSAEFNNLTIRGTFDGTDYILSATGFFLYSGTPASGNLIASIAPVSTTADSFANTVTGGGFTSYDPATGELGELAAGFLKLRPAGLAAGGASAFVEAIAPGDAILFSGQTSNVDTAATVEVISAAANAGTAQVNLSAAQATLNTAAAQPVPLTAPAATSAAIIAALKTVGVFK